jgi:alpha-L-rhamnosidase
MIAHVLAHTFAAADGGESWSGRWRGRWIWDAEPPPVAWWAAAGPRPGRFTYLRRAFQLSVVPASLPVRATCDSRYVLFVNGHEVGRGPVRDDPAFLGWDEHDLGPHLRRGANVVVALCRYYGAANPWWLPAPQSGSLGSGSFCFETHPDAPVDLVSDESWHAVATPWLPSRWEAFHGVAPEIVDGRLAPRGLHDPDVDGSGWPPAAVLRGRLGTVLDRPPAAPYSAPLRRPIPQLVGRALRPVATPVPDLRVEVESAADPVTAWRSLRPEPEGPRRLAVHDMGRICLGHVRLRLAGAVSGDVIDAAAGEDLRPDGLPEIEPRRWAARYIAAGTADEATFFDPVGFRYLAVHGPEGATVDVEVDERLYPRPDGAGFECDDPRYIRVWEVGARTVDLCSTDAFVDCPGREQRAWLGDAYVQGLVSLVTNPDWRLVRHNLALAARSRRADGLLGMAAACDVARAAATIPDYSLHWIRALADYHLYSGDDEFARAHVNVADGIIERYEERRGPSGLLEDFPGWVFVDWAQVGRDTITGAHDALYALTLQAYSTLPGARDTRDLVDRTAAGFEALWDEQRGIYVDTLGRSGPGRRVSQQTNSAAVAAGIVPESRMARVIGRLADPGSAVPGGRLVVTATPGDAPKLGATTQWLEPAAFDVERDVVACQPFFAHILHAAFHRAERSDLLLASLLRWHTQVERGAFQEYWDAPIGTSSRCHGWAACPTYDLVAYVLGVRPLAPGYAHAIVDPRLGHLRRAWGRVPTPHGWLEVGVELDEVTVAVPEGVVVRVGRRELASGKHRVRLSG